MSISLAASRTSGVAPLAVFFDATGTTSSSPIRPFHDIEYRWDFGDPAGTTWSNGSRAGSSKNSATGPVAAHVYETPGPYTVTLTAFDGVNLETVTVLITVDDPESVFNASTICIGAASPPQAGVGGCPPGAAVTAQSDFNTAVNSSLGAGMRRLLFKRGDTFTSTSDAVIDVTGPGIMGAFGSGSVPVVSLTDIDTIAIRLSDRDTPTIRDWRIMDLEINGNSGSATRGISAAGGFDQVTLLRLNIHHVHLGFHFSPFVLDFQNSNGHPGHKLWDQLAIVDSNASTIIGGSGGNGGYIGAQRFSFMGNMMNDSTAAEHVLRLNHVFKGVIGHNTMSNPAPTKGVIKMQGHPFIVAPTGATELVVISDNKFTTGTSAPWNVNMGPQDGVSNETVKDVIVERNWFAPHPSQNIALMIFAANVTVRNNLFNLTGALEQRGVVVSHWGLEPVTHDVHVYNNTFYSNSGGDFQPIGFLIGSGHIAKNNLGYASNSSSRDMVSGTATDSNNTSDAGILVTPSFTNASGTLSLPADFGLAAGSNALNQGAVVPVFSDFFVQNRPLNGGFDQGANEGP